MSVHPPPSSRLLIVLLGLALPATIACRGDGEAETDSATASSETAETEGTGEDAPEPGIVEVHTDAQGIAHLVAASDRSVFWASGYVQAETRLVQMLLLRRRALGRQAEVLGVDKLDEDQLSRLFDFAGLGSRDMARLHEEHPEDHLLIEAWVAGVNAYIAAVDAGEVEAPAGLDALGIEPEQWTVDDVGAIAKLLMFGNSNSLEYELLTTILARLDPTLLVDLTLPLPAYPVFTLPPEDVPAGDRAGPSPRARRAPGTDLPPAPALDDGDAARIGAGLRRLHATLDEFSVDGSNAWVVAGAHTASGRPMLANDPHQPLSSPALVYGLHLDSRRGEGSFNVAGFAFAGTPGVQLGHNEAVAWGATTGTADVMDMWSVSADPMAQTVDVGGQSVEYVPREETIVVRGQDDVILVVDEVPGRGILLGDALLEGLGINEAFVAGAGRRLLLGWTGFQHGNELHAFFAMARADSADDFQAAAEQMEVGTFNWMFADAQSIGYRSRVRVPDRGDPASIALPFLMLDGDDPSTLWTGAYLDDALLPGSRDPSQGYLLSANNEPYGFTVDGDLSNDPFYFGTYFLPGFRAKRGVDELERLIDADPVTLSDMQALQTDTYATEADLIVPLVATAWAAVGSDPDLDAYLGRDDLGALASELEAWDRRMDADSGPALAFYVFAHELARASIGDEMALVFDAVVEAAPAFALKFSALAVTGAYPGSDALVEGSVDARVLEALDATAAWMSANTGAATTDGLRWDEFHVTRFASPVAALTWGEVGSPGSVGTLNQNTATYLDGSEAAVRFISEDGPMFRGVVAFDDEGTPRLHYSFAPGNGGDPDAAHWGDLVDAWITGRYFEMPFSPQEVEAASVEVRTIEVPEGYR
ncbi:penicillin acylase family protein [Paraliomyxa miuraensis]|uniref:penicillin acylase family protein n=1 Tax=Paraliomyxa miuraensis TaxID=376150 RepID=UPI00224E70A7|nr:penicillin acylase family protein [Paraliomyxa miuraensis]MCX4243337.1 penicillin acylase family protein [Paraliomyxa miuraensis]